MDLIQQDCCPYKTTQIWADRQAQEEDDEGSHVMMETETGSASISQRMARISDKHQRPGKARKNSILQVSKEHGPLKH